MGERKTSVHSVRCDDEVWTKARTRATEDGVNMNFVLGEILEGYGDGKLNLPEVTVTKTWE